MATPVRVTTFLVALVVFFCAFHWGLGHSQRPPPDAVFRFTPPDVVWPVVPSMLLAIIAADLVGGVLLRGFFPDHPVHETSASPFGRWTQRHSRPIYAAGAVTVALVPVALFETGKVIGAALDLLEMIRPVLEQ